MFRYWLKNRSLFSVVSSILISLLVSIVFIPGIISDYAGANNELSIYEKTQIDFDVPSPGFAQVGELNEMGHIESVIPYYFTTKGTNHNNKAIVNIGMLMFDNFELLNKSMYNDLRAIDVSAKEVENPLFIDYGFAKKFGIKIGDELKFEFSGVSVPFEVFGIYENNTYYQGNVVAGLWNGEQKRVTEENLNMQLKYSGAYIISNHIETTNTYLRNEYKPYGLLRNPEDFATEEAYQTHYNAFMNASYANEITNFRERENNAAQLADNLVKSGRVKLTVSLTIIILAMLIFNIAMVLRKSEAKYFLTRKRMGANVKQYITLNLLSEVFIGAIIFTGAIFISVWISPMFVSKTIIVVTIITLLIGQLFAGIVSFLTSSLIVNKAS